MDTQAKKSSIKTVAALLWLAIVSAIILAIAYQDRFFARTIPTVAEVSLTKGDVSYRNESKVRWNDAEKGTQLADGDRVATGRTSSAVITFSDGRKLRLTEDAQIIISTITHSDSGVTFLINLVKGSIIADAKADCAQCREMIVKAGGDSFTVANGSRAGFFRDGVAGKVQRFKADGPIPKQTSLVGSEPKKISKRVDIPVAVPSSTPAIKRPAVPPPQSPPPTAAASGAEFSVRPPSEGRVLWTHKSVAELFNAKLSVPVVRQSRELPFKNFVPVIEVSDMAGSRKEIVAGRTSTDAVIDLALVKVRMIATQRFSGVKQYQFQIRGGIRVFDSGKPVDTISGAPVQVTINSLGEVMSTPIAVGLDRLEAAPPGDIWMAPKQLTSVGSMPIQVTLFQATDYQRIIPFAVASNQFAVMAAASSTAPVANIVRDGVIVAQVNRYRSANDVRAVMKSIGGAFAFVGQRGLYQYSAGNSQDNVVSVIDELLDKGRVIYFYKNKRLYPVNRTFVRNSKEVASFLGKQANQYFTEKVEIID